MGNLETVAEVEAGKTEPAEEYVHLEYMQTVVGLGNNQVGVGMRACN